MTTVILVSHSIKITDGLKEMIEEMTGQNQNVKIFSAGGTDDNRLGTNPIKIYSIIEQQQSDQNILIFADIGSAILSAETAIELIEDETLKQKVTLIDAPLVEGAFIASIQASITNNIDEILAELRQI